MQRRKWVAHLMNALINYDAVCREAPATQGLLINCDLQFMAYVNPPIC